MTAESLLFNPNIYGDIMGLFDRKTDYSDMNGLKIEDKILIIKINELIEEIESNLKERGIEISLPYKMQLKSDISEIRRVMNKIRPEKDNAKIISKLEFLHIKLRTEAENIFG